MSFDLLRGMLRAAGNEYERVRAEQRARMQYEQSRPIPHYQTRPVYHQPPPPHQYSQQSENGFHGCYPGSNHQTGNIPHLTPPPLPIRPRSVPPPPPLPPRQHPNASYPIQNSGALPPGQYTEVLPPIEFVDAPPPPYTPFQPASPGVIEQGTTIDAVNCPTSAPLTMEENPSEVLDGRDSAIETPKQSHHTPGPRTVEIVEVPDEHFLTSSESADSVQSDENRELRNDDTPTHTPEVAPSSGEEETPAVKWLTDCPCADKTLEGKGFITSCIPDMDVCEICFTRYVASTPFAPSFRPTTYPSPSTRECSLLLLAVLNRWKDACSRIEAAADARTCETYLLHFGKAHDAIFARAEELVQRIQSLKQEISIGSIQQRHQQNMGMMQMSFGVGLSAASIGSSYGYGGSGSSYASAAGNARCMEAGKMLMQIEAKKIELEGLIKEYKQLVGLE